MGEDERFQAERRDDRVEALDAEVGVLEVAQNRQVDCHTAAASVGPACTHARGADFEADPVVPQGDTGEQCRKSTRHQA